mgnify:CR=1 FL=1
MVNGKPLVQFPVEAAARSKYVDEIWVATDSSGVSNAVLDLGLMGKLYVYRRSDESSQDNSNSEDVLLEFAKKYESHGFGKPDFDIMIFMQCTAPLTETEDIDGALELLVSDENINSVISGCEDSGGWFCGGFQWQEKDYAERVTPYVHQRQDAPKFYRENGAFYISYKKDFIKEETRLPGNIKFYEMPKNRSFEVDEPEDLDVLRSNRPPPIFPFKAVKHV